ncbi:MAG: SDR family NAD(P)-dependent oxidoreductase [Gammaproteobacteria bacterium]|nr:SDR family NAD(P)-dependent oxidoreductase [Gammaproteobacteria bacterium]
MRAAREAPRCVLITGATGGIGAALAREYAAPGMTLILHGRSTQRLEAIAADARSAGARVLTRVCDLRDVPALRRWLAEVSAVETLDLFIANAGVNTNIGADRAGERWEAAEALLDTNVKGTIAGIDAVLPAMRRRRRGQIAIISSLAAFYGLPVTPSYSASKAALKAYGEALRGWLRSEGIRVNVVMPGYVESAMCREMPGPKPFLWPAQRAARIIRRRLAADQPRISFPAPLSWGCWWLSVAHPRVAERILHLLHYDG